MQFYDNETFNTLIILGRRFRIIVLFLYGDSANYSFYVVSVEKDDLAK